MDLRRHAVSCCSRAFEPNLSTGYLASAKVAKILGLFLGQFEDPGEIANALLPIFSYRVGVSFSKDAAVAHGLSFIITQPLVNRCSWCYSALVPQSLSDNERKLLHSLIHGGDTWWQVVPKKRDRNPALDRLLSLGLIEVNMGRGMRATSLGIRSNQLAKQHDLVP